MLLSKVLDALALLNGQKSSQDDVVVLRHVHLLESHQLRPSINALDRQLDCVHCVHEFGRQLQGQTEDATEAKPYKCCIDTTELAVELREVRWREGKFILPAAPTAAQVDAHVEVNDLGRSCIDTRRVRRDRP